MPGFPRKKKGRKTGKGARAQRGARKRSAPAPERRELHVDALRAIIERAGRGPLGAEEREQLSAAIDTLAFITHELEHSAITIARLRKLIFGPSSEKTRDVVGGAGRDDASSAAAGDTCAGSDEADAAGEGDEPDRPAGVGEEDAEAATDVSAGRRGHGRNGADAYEGAKRIAIKHDSLEHGDRCPACSKGKVYRQRRPAVVVRVRGVAPLEATVHELERLRCNLCGDVFVARSPPDVGEEKYDETAAAMIALMKYGCGLPFNRLSRLGKNLGIPLPASTQWKVVKAAAIAFEPVWEALLREAAAGKVVHIDDTGMTILSVAKQIKKELAAGETDRTGIFTSGVVSTAGKRKIAVYFTGREHAGENLAKLLALRPGELGPVIQMCDALSRNVSPGTIATILANCLVHLRRQFVDVVAGFPNEVARVLETLREVYLHEARARKAQLSPEDRLAYHQKHSDPLLRELKAWLDGLLEDKMVEPNSGLGGAIRYFDNHWDALTAFLRVPGAPIDNNLCERAIKRVIMHRKNSLFFKTKNGARVGDMFLSVIHTAELCGANPFEYLVAVQRHRDAVSADPDRWLPWNYAEALP